MSEHRGKFEALLEEFKAQGLKSIDLDGFVDIDDAAEASENAEAYYAELCRLFESIKNGEGSKLVFKDSQKKIK